MTTTQYYVNGKVFTARNERDFVTAFKVVDGKIDWVGLSEEVNDTNTVDLRGKTVLPGFLDVHTHPVCGQHFRKRSLHYSFGPEYG